MEMQFGPRLTCLKAAQIYFHTEVCMPLTHANADIIRVTGATSIHPGYMILYFAINTIHTYEQATDTNARAAVFLPP